MIRVIAVTLTILASACAMPSTTVRTGETRPSLALTGSPPGTTLFVDGQPVGEAAAFDGQPSVLRVEPGTHDVELRDVAGRTVFRQRVFVESELKTIEVH